jgi:hypothetical protein
MKLSEYNFFLCEKGDLAGEILMECAMQYDQEPGFYKDPAYPMPQSQIFLMSNWDSPTEPLDRPSKPGTTVEDPTVE